MVKVSMKQRLRSLSSQIMGRLWSHGQQQHCGEVVVFKMLNWWYHFRVLRITLM